jgi:hypothetical protein
VYLTSVDLTLREMVTDSEPYVAGPVDAARTPVVLEASVEDKFRAFVVIARM